MVWKTDGMVAGQTRIASDSREDAVAWVWFEREEDLKLAVAAPEMLEFLKWLRDTSTPETLGGKTYGYLTQLINKAEGA